ncbi:MAG TPA: SIMPL domain-containing protein [Allosphingosinicella sp.]|jgi:hypothetical protein
MRKFIVVVWLAASSLLIAVPAAADSPVNLPPLAPGEVLLEINAVGISQAPATGATISVAIAAEETSEASARRAGAAAVQRVTAAARAAGVAAADVDASTLNVSSTTYGGGNYTSDMLLNAADTLASGEIHYASGTVTIRLRNAAAGPALHRNLAAIDNVTAAAPVYTLDDDSTARRAARTEAMRRARADAESYVEAMNMRIARILRVTERTGLDFLGMALSESNTALRTFRDYERSMAEGQVMTFVVVGVDYALAPR